MFKIHKEELEVNGKKLILETGKVARQADGAIIASLGETVVIATVVGAKKLKDGQDYFPLSVNYQEKFYAAGKIPGGYFKREARPTEAETLISRLIDRPIRPLFPSSFMNEVQLLPTVLSYDGENQPDVLSIIASSAALAISGLPFQGPVAASRVGYKDGKYLLNPSLEELKDSELDLVVAGTKDAVLMVESETSGLSEKVMLDAVKFGHEKFVPIIEAIEKLAKKAGKPKWEIEEIDHSNVKKQIADKFEAGLRNAFKEIDKKKRSTAISEIETQCKEMFAEDENVSENQAMAQLKSLEKDIVRTAILKDKKRIDGRGLADVRQIQCEVGVLPRTHGSALFTRGETQALVVTTLGMTDDEQRLESLEGMQRSNFMLHYNFPPFSGLRSAFKEIDKKKRSNAIVEIETQCKEMFVEDENVSENQAMAQLKSLEKDIVRTAILKDKKRIDGRGLADVRQIKCEVGVLPRTHGSALFTRGETQALVVTTLGMTDDEQRLESLEGMQRSNFMLHYNFPPFSVGECGRIGTGRREIGHGKLAWRAISSSLPLKENFPYTLKSSIRNYRVQWFFIYGNSLWNFIIIDGCWCSN